MSTTLKEEKVRKKREQQDQTKRKEKEDMEEWIRERRKEKKKRKSWKEEDGLSWRKRGESRKTREEVFVGGEGEEAKKRDGDWRAGSHRARRVFFGWGGLKRASLILIFIYIVIKQNGISRPCVALYVLRSLRSVLHNPPRLFNKSMSGRRLPIKIIRSPLVLYLVACLGIAPDTPAMRS